MKLRMGKSRQGSFHNSDVLGCPNESRFKSQNNYLVDIDDQITELHWL